MTRFAAHAVAQNNYWSVVGLSIQVSDRLHCVCEVLVSLLQHVRRQSPVVGRGIQVDTLFVSLRFQQNQYRAEDVCKAFC